jgi:hypothetical protein
MFSWARGFDFESGVVDDGESWVRQLMHPESIGLYGRVEIV